MTDKLALPELRLLYPLLLLERRVVGVRFLFTEEEFDEADAKPLTAKQNYCVMVRAASNGNSIKARLENFSCLSGAKTLGLLENDEYNSSGRFYRDKGMYRDLAVCRDVCNNMTACSHRAVGVQLRPVEAYAAAQPPDVVILVVSPYQAMRLVQAYTYHFGTCDSFKMTGNKAFCSECTAYPFEHNQMNLSMLCAGTRHKAGWGDGDMAVGIPAGKLAVVVDGLRSTLNNMEPNDKKEAIGRQLCELGVDLPIEMDKNYYTGLFLK